MSEKPRSQITSTAARSICSRRWSGPLAASAAASLPFLSFAIRPSEKPACPWPGRLHRLNSQSDVQRQTRPREPEAWRYRSLRLRVIVGRASRRRPAPCSSRARSRSSARAPGRAASATGWSPRSRAARAARACTWSTRGTPRSRAGPACRPSADLDGPVDLVLLGVPDAALEASSACRRARRPVGRRSSAASSARRADGRRLLRRRRSPSWPARPGWRSAAAAAWASSTSPGACARSGTSRPSELPGGPIALVSHSGSAFSALLRSHRRLGFSLAVSSGQELVTTAADYLDYALDQPETGVVALLLETMRSPERLRAGLARAAEQDVPVVALTVGTSGPGAAMVAAHSGALAGGDGAWEALFDAYGVLPGARPGRAGRHPRAVRGRAPRRAPAPRGIATVHDSRRRAGHGGRPGRRAGRAVRAAGAGDGRPADRAARPRAGADQPARRVGHRGRHPRPVRRVAAGDGGRPGGRGRSRWPSTWSPSTTATSPIPLRVQDVWAATDLPVAVLSTMHSALDQAQAPAAAGATAYRCSKAPAAAWSRWGTSRRTRGRPARRPSRPPVVDAGRQAALARRAWPPDPLDGAATSSPCWPTTASRW